MRGILTRASAALAAKALGVIALAAACGLVAYGVGSVLLTRSGYEAPAAPAIGQPPSETSVTSGFGVPRSSHAPTRPALAAGGRGEASGVLVVDAAHRNAFREVELKNFLTLVSNRGYEVQLLGDFGPPAAKAAVRAALLEEKLRGAGSLLVILPRTAYTEAEVAVVARFVDKGGRLLLMSDPTRPHVINSLAERFGLSFQPDYLYNMVENDRNYRHIYVRDFQPEELTAGLSTVALYTAGSVRTVGAPLAYADENTRSSLAGSGSGLSPVAWGSSRNVLALADITFIVPPHDAFADNGRLLSNLADYLTAGVRDYELADFPRFYAAGASGGVDVLASRPELINVAAELRGTLAEYGIDAAVRTAEDVSRDTVFIGLYEDARRVQPYLANAGVRVDDTLGGPFAADVALNGTALTLLDAGPGRHVLIILADAPGTVNQAVANLLNGGFRKNLVSDLVSFGLPAKSFVKPTPRPTSPKSK